MAVVLPGFTFTDLGPDGGPYDEIKHPKICWHTTEGSSLAGAEAAFKAYPPHLGYDPRTRIKRQYVSLDRHSYALRGGESDDEYVIQIEVVGRAAETGGWPAEWYRNIGLDLIRPLRNLLRIPDRHLRFYGPNEGIVLATATSPIRLSNEAFRAFTGHLGHQHVPAPDSHWDPGGFRIDEAIDYSHNPDIEQEIDMALTGYERDMLERVSNRVNAVSRFQEAIDAEMSGIDNVKYRLQEPVEIVTHITALEEALAAVQADVAELKARPAADVDEAQLAAELESHGGLLTAAEFIDILNRVGLRVGPAA
mgnify:CR=1 FL=1